MDRAAIEKRLRKAQLLIDLDEKLLSQQHFIVDQLSPRNASRALSRLRDLEYMQAVHRDEAERLRRALANVDC